MLQPMIADSAVSHVPMLLAACCVALALFMVACRLLNRNRQKGQKVSYPS